MRDGDQYIIGSRFIPFTYKLVAPGGHHQHKIAPATAGSQPD
jgi:hypothetical protein